MINEAIIITEDHYNALGVIRSLGEKGISVNLIITTEDEDTYIDRSIYVSSVIKVEHNEDKIIDALKSATQEDKKYFIFPLSDYTALIVDKNFKNFKENIICPNMNGEMLRFQDKSVSKSLAQRCGMNTANSKVIDLNKSYEWSSYPCIVKPLVSQEGSKGDITIVSNETELRNSLAQFANKNYERVLIEVYITGEDERMVEVLGCSFKEDVFIAGIIKKIREYPMRRGSTSFAEIVRNHKDIDFEKIKSFIRESGYIGLFDMEFKYADGICYFIECNFRNGAPSYAFTVYGRNIPANWILGITEKGIDTKKFKNDSMLFMCEQTDILNMIKKEVGIKQWLREFNHSKKIFYSKHDKSPVKIYYKKFFLMIIKRIKRR